MAAAVAAASLAVTAWGTWKSALVADDQLSQSREAKEQSREAREEDQRKQVSRITFWPEGDKVIIVNRSYDTANVSLKYGPDQLPIGLIPPCKQLSLDRTKLIAPIPVELVVIDAAGMMWRRHESGQVTGEGWVSGAYLASAFDTIEPAVKYRLTRAEGCG
ncbi:hypothetical protein [Streptomyces caniscabiei]|uniref:hypothetical protein n=1 Tax=Streptomyces caniscabiei TaxID=2746961 RepID=UPI0029A5A0B1|nr:hypothetical protein [Streptomyces caniscabiei]MDX2986330.1 hypothetical protein [Streptomyces caniscabiei]